MSDSNKKNLKLFLKKIKGDDLIKVERNSLMLSALRKKL